MTVSPDRPDRRIRLTLHYDGEGFSGWQVQPESRTVQGVLESALERLTGAPIAVVGAGRTDAGVHAVGQVASARVPARWTAGTLARALNAVLPHDVWLAGAEEVALDFHARYDAVARSYVYRVGTRRIARSPFCRRWCWPLVRPLDAAMLDSAAQCFVGTHSFRAFSKTGQPERGYRCTIYRSEWTEWAAAGYEYRVSANRFLHHMVRYMVGTMVDVARGRRPAEDIAALLAAEPGLETSPPAPAAGLCLVKVDYDEPADSHTNGGAAAGEHAWPDGPAA